MAKYQFLLYKIICSVFFYLSTNLVLAQNGTTLTKLEAISLCDSVEVFLHKARPILYQKKTDGNKLCLSVRVKYNCGVNNLIGAFNYHGDTLNLLVAYPDDYIRADETYEIGKTPTNKGIIEMVDCECYVQFDYHFTVSKIPEQIIFHSERLYPPDELYNIVPEHVDVWQGEKVNRIDSIGNKQGKWITTDSTNQVVSEEMFLNDESISTSYFNYYPDKTIKEKVVIDGKTTIFKSGQNGHLFRQCIEETMIYEIPAAENIQIPFTKWVSIETCFDFDSEGKIIKETVIKKD